MKKVIVYPVLALLAVGLLNSCASKKETMITTSTQPSSSPTKKNTSTPGN